MYGLSMNTDLTFFRGVELLQICVGANELVLNFEHDVSLTIESEVEVLRSGGAAVAFEDSRAGAPLFFALLHDTVEAAVATEDGALVLTFGSGTRVEVRDSNKCHESFQISHGQHMIVV